MSQDSEVQASKACDTQIPVAEVILGFVPYIVSRIVMQNGSCSNTGSRDESKTQ